MNGIMLPTPPQPPMFKHQRPNRVTGILYHAGLWNIAGFYSREASAC